VPSVWPIRSLESGHPTMSSTSRQISANGKSTTNIGTSSASPSAPSSETSARPTFLPLGTPASVSTAGSSLRPPVGSCPPGVSDGEGAFIVRPSVHEGGSLAGKELESVSSICRSAGRESGTVTVRRVITNLQLKKSNCHADRFHAQAAPFPTRHFTVSADGPWRLPDESRRSRNGGETSRPQQRQLMSVLPICVEGLVP
jgi:hypothetical protein